MSLYTVDSLMFASIEVHDLGMSDICGVLILRVLHLAFYFHMQALYFVSFIFATLMSL